MPVSGNPEDERLVTLDIAEKGTRAFDGFMHALHHGDQTDFGVWRERLRSTIGELQDEVIALRATCAEASNSLRKALPTDYVTIEVTKLGERVV